LIGIGLYFRKKASKNLRSYFLGSNKLPWWAMGISGMASFFDVSGTMLIVSFLYLLGPRGIFIEFRGGAVLVLVFWLLWMGKWQYRSKCVTGAEWMTYRFGNKWDGNFARIVTAVAAIVLNIGMLVYMIKGLGLLLSMFLNYSPMECSLIIIVITTLYTMISGFYGIVYIDSFQSIFLLAAVVIVTILAINTVDVQNLAVVAKQVTGNSNWISSLPSIKTEMPAGYKTYEPVAFLALFYLFRNVITGMATGNDPRYFGARNERECGSLTLLWTFLMMFRWPMMMGFAVLGIYLIKDIFPNHDVLIYAAHLIKQYYPAVTKENWSELISHIINLPGNTPHDLIREISKLFGDNWKYKLHLLSFEGTVNPEKILPAVIMHYSPAGSHAFVLITILAASMSALNTTMNSTAAFFTRDIYERFLRPNSSSKEYIYISYAFIFVFVFIAFTLAFTIQSVNDIWAWITMSLGAGIFIPAFLKFYWWRFNGTGFAVGTLTGIFTAICQRLLFPELAEWLQFSIVTTIGFSASIIATYLSPNTDYKVLSNFYTTTRPFGIWGKFKNILAPEIKLKMIREQRNDIIAVPFNLIGQVLLFLMPMQLIIGTYFNFTISFVIFLICCFGMYRFWYKNLPPVFD
jgi:Na+/proline symporter